MIPDLDAVRVTHAFLVRRFRLKGALNEVGIHTALALARGLAEHEADEPAALFYALVCFPLSLGDAWRTLPILIALNHATSLGYRVRATRVDLLPLYEPIRTNAMPFDDVRAWFARRLEPL